MFLAVDVGNTDIHVGLFEGEDLRADWRLEAQPVGTADAYERSLREMLGNARVKPEDLEGVIVASVVPVVTQALEAVARRWPGRDPLTVGPHLRLPVEMCVDEPSRVGADRIANAVAACRWREPPVIAVDLGTATTFDVVDGRSRYLGGVICPGVLGALEALVRGTAQLPPVEVQEPANVIGASTEEAMRSGIVFGTAAGIDGVVRRIWRELGGACPVVATGGLSASICAHCECVHRIDPHLTLKGLGALFDLNR